MPLLAGHRPDGARRLILKLKAFGERNFVLGFANAAHLADIAQLDNSHTLNRKGGFAYGTVGNGAVHLAAKHPNNVGAVIR
ncbi:hypothetical protein DSECCO2_612420 [anaerobic digester metagenome]